MSPLSWPVLGASLLVASPALYAWLVEGTVSVDTAFVRLAIVAGGAWAVLSVAASLTTDALAATRRQRLEAEAEAARQERAAG
ncbi:MAG: hypothetical protein ACXVWZ_00895 [Nocardioides sp.]